MADKTSVDIEKLPWQMRDMYMHDDPDYKSNDAQSLSWVLNEMYSIDGSVHKFDDLGDEKRGYDRRSLSAGESYSELVGNVRFSFVYGRWDLQRISVSIDNQYVMTFHERDGVTQPDDAKLPKLIEPIRQAAKELIARYRNKEIQRDLEHHQQQQNYKSERAEILAKYS